MEHTIKITIYFKNEWSWGSRKILILYQFIIQIMVDIFIKSNWYVFECGQNWMIICLVSRLYQITTKDIVLNLHTQSHSIDMKIFTSFVDEKNMHWIITHTCVDNVILNLLVQ